jgi:hypothetical protein
MKNPRMVTALKLLKKLQDKHSGVVESADLPEESRSLLVTTGFLRQVSKGWYVCSNPKDAQGDSTSWYASFWAFLSGYLRKRFGKRYCLNPEASLLLQTGGTVIPPQVTAVTRESGNSVLTLPFNTSLLMYQDERRVPRSRVEVQGLQVLPLPEALCRVQPRFFVSNPREIEIALAQIRDVSELLTTLLADDGLPTSAGRLAGAMAQAGRQGEADRIVNTMGKAGFKVSVTNPYADIPGFAPTIGVTRDRSPYVLRLKSMWAGWREDVLSIFPSAPGLSVDPEGYLNQVQDRYVADAYNSLSIEGYQVSDALIERVARNGWNPDDNPEDTASKDAMAARGYYQAFQGVKQTINDVLGGENVIDAVKRAHHEWHGELFAPAVALGIVKKHELAGYRTGPVFIRNSQHTPLPREAILDSMEALFDLLGNEPAPAVRAVLGHHLFVFIHPYFDGNGRLGRFLMNVMLASGGYPWTVIRMTSRKRYMEALEDASVKGNIKPFAQFVLDEMNDWSPEKS